ncbi:MAG: hypothetical protein GX235_10625 [Clostridiales bacterium]|nr:hypothetical protein [Clostridiales bacterium]
MAKNKEPQTDIEQKAKTKYDRKMEERKKQEIKDKRKQRIMQVGAIVIGLGIIAAIAGSIVVSILDKHEALNSPYVTIGNYEVTQPEYEYYYSTTVNNYLSTYSPILSYIGLDPSVDFDKQQYTEDMTWKDLFDQMTVEQIKQTKALLDDAEANQFSYDITEEYANILSSISAQAQKQNLSVSDYYADAYGPYATEKRLEPYIKDNILAQAYYNELLTQNVPTNQDIKDYYAEHTKEYDKVDYRSFIVKADIADGATDEEKEKAMLKAKQKADAMMEARKAGADFKELALENASEKDKATYQDTESDATLNEGRVYSGIVSTISGWLFEEGRTEGDITVLEDKTDHQYYVVEFANRYYDEATDKTISDTIAAERVAEYISKLEEPYSVTDNKGNLKYLTIDPNEEITDDTVTDTTE